MDLVPTPVFDRKRSLCNVCQSVLQAFAAAADRAVLGETTERLEARSAHGCRLCSLFLKYSNLDGDKVDRFYKKYQDREKITISYTKKDVGGFLLYLYIKVTSHGPNFGKNLEAGYRALKPTTLPIASEDDLKERLTVSDESLRLAKKWIVSCRAEHIACGENTTTFRPTRLIEIGFQHVDQIRLCLGTDIHPDASYYTLSHCWGAEPMPQRLLKDNIQSRFSYISYSQLPPNFKDAISIVKRLGGRYLWVDSLCIIQDSTEDWEHESSLMGQVYLNGYCNLSAAASKSSSVGMVFEREPLDILPFRTTLDIESGEPEVYICDPDLWQKMKTWSPLLRRGWVCQERLLSACNLLFGETQIWWECSTLTACEIFPRGIPLEMEKYQGTPGIKQLVSQLVRSSCDPSEEPSLEDELHPLRLWNLVVEIYSGCKVSYGSDKLVALAGIAAITHEKLGKNSGKYLAGLWQKHLPYQLLWDATSLSDDVTRPSYRAPTWSWASVDWSLSVHSPSSCTPLMEVIDAHVDLISDNPYGQVKGGYIRVKCALTPVRTHEEIQALLFTTYVKIVVSCGWEYPHDSYLGGAGEIFYILPVCSGTSNHELTGLIVAKAKDNSGDFVRCGVFQAAVEDAGDLTENCRLFAEDAASHGLTCSDEFQDGMKFAIRTI